VLGHDVVRDAHDVRRSIGLAGQYAAVDEELTGRENLEMIGRLYRLPGPEARRRADDVLERFRPTDAADRAVSTYSGGMRRRLDLGASLTGRPSRMACGAAPRGGAACGARVPADVIDGRHARRTIDGHGPLDPQRDPAPAPDHRHLAGPALRRRRSGSESR
jgi:ABC-type arginine transport system ATPase subunit